ncbi:phosphotransferase [Kitasatospora cineracea]|uniref:Phosphotransferase family enzyme n=1 Tax=Kitasatospora cineracea TaxID=88074 RepID=A0A3N4RZ21_9ACTN|nr:phosphotransferase [Kitasatospora cineracea]ROR45842.1 phosphotransferase family enzyme [Kitasatospora cineracea]RPE36209.1 phosphotransferase family enzyme [Kitasatospora cineracea]
MSNWEFVKDRTATQGAVWRSTDGLFYKRTGGEDLRAEAEFQRLAGGLGYPVPEIVGSGSEDGRFFVVERAVGGTSLHEEALADAVRDGRVSHRVIGTAAAVASKLLRAQARHPLPAAPWFEKAAFASEVFAENPDLDTPRVHDAVRHALDRLARLPLVRGHLDYGLPNVLQAGVVDWQHHGPVPLGYDVYPALDIVAFKGGGKGYTIAPEQRAAYTAALDETTAPLIGQRVSEHLGDFLLVKCFFFLALMRPTDPARHDKHVKWQYRRTLFTTGLDQYESGTTIDTGTFPTLERFTAEHR